MAECPDCKKKMTKKTLKYSHAKNCTAKISARPKEASALPAVQEAEDEEEDEEEEEEEEPETEEEEEEVKPSPAPILKRTVSVAYPIKVRDPPQPTVQKVCPSGSQPPPVKETVNKVKPEQPQHIKVSQQPTPTNIYGRENRNERAKQKTEKMCNLFVNAF